MGLKSYIRERLIAAVQYAVREELKNQNYAIRETTETVEREEQTDRTEEIIARLDKQIERWTWERYQRVKNDDITKLENQLSNDSWILGNRVDKRIEKWTWERFQRTDKAIEKWTWERFQRTDKAIEKWTWERFKRTEEKLDLMIKKLEYQQNKIPYLPGEPIRIAILYQIPSCWPSIEPIYNILQNDERFEATILLYDRELGEPVQMAGARDLLIEKGIEFREAEYYNFRIERPHILLYQTPWDKTHRPSFLRADEISSMGIRIAYVPYGVHYTASGYQDFIFSDNKFMAKPWFMSCLSEELRIDHLVMSNYGGNHVFVTGHPKFDSLVNKEDYKLDEEINMNIGNRIIVFIQMHFAEKEGMPYVPEPDIEVYTHFLRKQSKNEKYFFLVRPHPKFFEMYEKVGRTKEVEMIKKIILDSDNMMIYDKSDYRPALFSANCIIGDRSALMVEAGVLGVPVLYMTNFYYQEQLLPSITPLFDSYYQGHTCYDMELFLDYVIEKGHDYKKEDREKAMHKCIPYLDGKCSQRIVDSIAKLITLEG